MYNILRCLFGRWSLVRRVGKGRFSYAGPYHGGHASYVYLETPSGRVYDGPFSFSGGSMTARTLFFNSPYDDGIIKFGGRYSRGRKTGRWKYQRRGRGYSRRLTVDYEHWEHGKLLESYTLDFSTGHRSEKAPSMLAMVKDIICEECMPLVNSVRRNAAVWDGDIKVKEA